MQNILQGKRIHIVVQIHANGGQHAAPKYKDQKEPQHFFRMCFEVHVLLFQQKETIDRNKDGYAL